MNKIIILQVLLTLILPSFTDIKSIDTENKVSVKGHIGKEVDDSKEIDDNKEIVVVVPKDKVPNTVLPSTGVGKTNVGIIIGLTGLIVFVVSKLKRKS